MSPTPIPRDEMTPLERVRAHKVGEPYDRLPVLLFIDNQAARIAGIPLAEYAKGGRPMAAAQIETYRRLRPDGLSTLLNTGILSEAMGARMAVPEDGIPYIVNPALKEALRSDGSPIACSPDEVRVLDAAARALEPPDPTKDGRLPALLDALELMLDELGEEVDIGATVPGPVTTAAGLVGAEPLCLLFGRAPETAHAVLAVSLAACIVYAEAAIARGGGASIAEPFATQDIIGPQGFRTFALPYLSSLVDAIESGAGCSPRAHICGHTELLWDDMLESGVSGVSLDDVDMVEAKRRIGGKTTLVGNVRPVETLLRGTPETVDQEVQRLIADVGDSPRGLIVAPGCELPVGTPNENASAMVNAVRRHGRWDGGLHRAREPALGEGAG